MPMAHFLYFFGPFIRFLERIKKVKKKLFLKKSLGIYDFYRYRIISEKDYGTEEKMATK